MAIYDYLCNQCAYAWEEVVLENNGEKGPEFCPRCMSPMIERKIGWTGMYTGEHKKAWDRPPPSNPTKVYIRRDKKP